MSDRGSSTNFPASMGPGARPVKNEAGAQEGLAEMMAIRSEYKILVDPASLQVGYAIRGQHRSYTMPFEAIPLGSFSQWLLYGGRYRSLAAGVQVIDILRGIENVTQRPVSQREAEGIACHASKRTLYSLSGNLTGCLVGGAIAFRTMSTMKFPFMAPKPVEVYSVFPSRLLPVLRGRAAQALWQITRGNVWAALCVMVSATLFSSMGNMSTTIGLARDPRTAVLAQQLRGRVDRIESNRARAAGSRQSDGGPQRSDQDQRDGFDDSDTDPSTFSPDLSAPSAPSDRDQAAASYNGSDMSADDPDPYNSMARDIDMSVAVGKGGVLDSERRWKLTPSQPEISRGSASDADVFFDDDVSPATGTDGDPATARPPKRPNGSTWDRIRRGIRPGDQMEPDTTASAYPRTPQPRDRAANDPREDDLSREQQQKAFNKMLERERRHGGADEYDRGTRAVEDRDDVSPIAPTSAWDRRRNE